MKLAPPKTSVPKLEFRNLLALVALGLLVLAMALEASGHPISEWLRTPLGTILSIILGFYFVDSARKGQGSAAEPPPPPAAAEPPAPPAEPAPAPAPLPPSE